MQPHLLLTLYAGGRLLPLKITGYIIQHSLEIKAKCGNSTMNSKHQFQPEFNFQIKTQISSHCAKTYNVLKLSEHIGLVEERFARKIESASVWMVTKTSGRHFTKRIRHLGCYYLPQHTQPPF